MHLSRSDGKALRAYVSTPESPATTFTQWNTVCIIPERELSAGATYQVELSCQVSGKPFKRSWKFTTEKAR